MSDIAIRASQIGKQYLIGSNRGQYKTLRDALTKTIMAPLRRMSKARDDHSRGKNTFWALKNISFDIREGEVVGVIGRNGAGKSTLLKILSRITEPTSGFVNLQGRVGALLEVGTGFHPELTGRENIYLNGAILGMKRSDIQRKFDDIVTFAGVEKFIDMPVKRYSTGMHTRLAFSVAAHLEPEILLIDEVLAVGDFAFQKKCLGKMKDVAGCGRTVIFVSHNMGAIRTLCDRCLAIESGQIVADGPSDQVVDRYLEQFNESAADGDSTTIEATLGNGFRLHHNGSRYLSIFCGDSIALEFDIEAPRPLAHKDAGIGIGIATQAGDPLVSMSSLVQAISLNHGNSRVWRVRCDMGRLPLNTGTYFVSVDIGNAERGDRLASFQNVLTVKVMENDVFGWGNSLPSPRWWGPLYWAPDWKIQPVD